MSFSINSVIKLFIFVSVFLIYRDVSKKMRSPSLRAIGADVYWFRFYITFILTVIYLLLLLYFPL